VETYPAAFTVDLINRQPAADLLNGIKAAYIETDTAAAALLRVNDGLFGSGKLGGSHWLGFKEQMQISSIYITIGQDLVGSQHRQ
jgi:hypothetical protein